MSDDLIKRSDAIKAVKRLSENYTGKGKRNYHPHVDFIVDELKYCVPSADRPQGEWIKRHGTINCSVCKRSNWSACFEDTVRSFKFCPNCGARMKGADDE